MARSLPQPFGRGGILWNDEPLAQYTYITTVKVQDLAGDLDLTAAIAGSTYMILDLTTANMGFKI